jgi:hypothetical protein
VAGHALKSDRVGVIHCQFLAGAYVPAAKENQVVANTPPKHIGIARVVDELRAASASAAIQKPVSIHLRNVNVFGRLYFPDLLKGETFAGVFNDTAASRNVLESKHSIPMKRRAPYPKTVIRSLRVDPVRLRLRRSHFATSKD